jgi:hypothetical protein
MMFGLPALYLRLAAYAAGALLIAGIGYKAGADHWEAKYQSLQAKDWQGKAAQEVAARKALETQLAQARAVSTNNEQVLHELQTQKAIIAADRDRTADLVHRLLARASRPSPASNPVPETPSESGTSRAGPSSVDGRAERLLVAAAEECRLNAAQLDALSAEIRPQL